MKTKDEILRAIDKLEKSPNDWGSTATQAGGAVVGAAGGAGSAAGVVGALGVTKIFILTKVAAWVGVTLVAATPPGWVVGLGVAGAAAGIGVARTAANAGRRQRARDQTLSYLRQELQQWEDKERHNAITSEDRTRFVVALREPLKAGLLPPGDAARLMQHVMDGWISVADACKQLEDLIY